MSQITAKDSKDQILKAFNQLLEERKKSDSKVETKEQEAEKDKNRELLQTVAGYTVDNIVNGMATLQLDFGSAIDNLSQQLETESGKLDELKQAISVETEHLQQLRQVRLVADSLYILKQENQEKLRILEEKTNNQREAINKERTQTEKAWKKEQEEFDLKVEEQTELLTKQREEQKEDYNYEIDRLRKVETDEYDEQERFQKRELAQLDRDKEKAWGEREKFLADNQAEFEENKEKIAGFDDKLAEEYKKAKEEAIKEAEREAKVKGDLLEKEWESSKKGYELKIESLQSTIERQRAEIAEITEQLQTATSQAQSLAMRAFQSSAQ